jgi:hypothetical protein
MIQRILKYHFLQETKMRLETETRLNCCPVSPYLINFNTAPKIDNYLLSTFCISLVLLLWYSLTNEKLLCVQGPGN